MNDNDNAKNTNNKHFLLQEEEFRQKSRDDLKTVWLLWLRPYLGIQKRTALAPPQKSYRIGFLFTYQMVISTRFP